MKYSIALVFLSVFFSTSNALASKIHYESRFEVSTNLGDSAFFLAKRTSKNFFINGTEYSGILVQQLKNEHLSFLNLKPKPKKGHCRGGTYSLSLKFKKPNAQENIDSAKNTLEEREEIGCVGTARYNELLKAFNRIDYFAKRNLRHLRKPASK